jgi:probable F420-dependent oxidoreductase
MASAGAGRVPVGIAMPQFFQEGPTDMEMVRQFVVRAEELGFESLWTQEDITGDDPSLEPLTQLSYVAALTQRVRLGVSVMVAPLRNPVQLAKALGSLDQMSHGRLTVGVGIGGRQNMYPAFGLTTDRRARRFVELLDVMKALWTEPQATYEGQFWQLDGVPMEPKPVQKPHPPLWFGGRHPDALRRAVRHGDGWMGAGSSTTATFLECVQQLNTFLEEAGRDPATFPISKRVYLAVDDNEKRAEERITTWFDNRYHNAPLGAEVSVWGSAAQCAEKLAEIVDGGAEMLMLNPMFDHMEHLEQLTEEVIPNI